MKSFLMNTEKFSEMPDQLKRQLNQFKVEKKDILLARLLVEEIFWRMVKRGKIEQFKIKVVKSFFGGVSIKMTSEGVPYNPLVEVEDFKEDEDEDDENYFNLMVINAYRQRLNYSRKNNLNIVTINIRRKSNSPAFLTIAAIVSGVGMRHPHERNFDARNDFANQRNFYNADANNVPERAEFAYRARDFLQHRQRRNGHK